jgi:hypothetical protein
MKCCVLCITLDSLFSKRLSRVLDAELSFVVRHQDNDCIAFLDTVLLDKASY